MHESSSADEYESDSASPRAFGLLIASILVVIAFLPVLHGKPVVVWAAAVSFPLFAVAVWAPVLLSGLTRVWLAFGGLLSKVVAPVAMAIVFFGVFTVYGHFLRLMGRDAMKRKRDTNMDSYWIERLPSETKRTHFNNQF
jgi:hypothetical protein